MKEVTAMLQECKGTIDIAQSQVFRPAHTEMEATKAHRKQIRISAIVAKFLQDCRKLYSQTSNIRESVTSLKLKTSLW